MSDKKCDICFDSVATQQYGNLGYCDVCWTECEKDRRCFICGSKENVISGTNFSRKYICITCLNQQESRFAKDLENALYGQMD